MSTVDTTEDLMTPAEVAAVFGVRSKTVAAWARSGRLQAVRTLGGHRRYRRADVLALLVIRPAGTAEPRAGLPTQRGPEGG